MKTQGTRLLQICLADEETSCVSCGGVDHCEYWCESVNAFVRYAHETARHPSHLSLGDRIILHALGVRWTLGRKRPIQQKFDGKA